MRIFHRYVPNSKQVLSESKRMAETREGIKCVVGINVRRGEVIPIEFSEPFQEVFATLQLYNPHASVIPYLPGLARLKQPSGETWSKKSLKFFEDCLERCTQNHKSCQQGDALLPKRVLDIGPIDGSVIKLFETRSGQTGKYAALSHCWGDVHIPRTVMDNFRNRLSGIDWDELTQVFKDAVTLARMFDVPYLWIDSLCIIQEGDGGNDWHTEARKMGSYYSNAYFTISSASAPDGSYPFLTDRDPKLLPATFKLFEHDPDSPTVCTRLIPRREEKRSDLFGRISTRAWCWQENVLSTRVLHFVPTELVWECKSELLSECDYRPDNIYAMGLINALKGVELDPMTKWHSLIQAYSQRSITKQSDRLTAVGAVAEKVSAYIRSEYHAGLWRSDLPRQLLWEVPSQRSADYLRPWPFENNYPSWSWASVEGRLRLGSETFGGSVKASNARVDTSYRALVPVARVESVACEPPPQNPFGEVKGGNMIVHGKVAQAYMVCDDPFVADSYKLQDPIRSNVKHDFSPDCILEKKQLGGISRSRGKKKDDDGWQVQRPGFAADVYLLIVCEIKKANGTPWAFDGLVLRRGFGGNTHSRIGFFSHTGNTFPWRTTVSKIKLV
ncbi:hypothetical protein ACEPPN_014055 [Leptodophora sp. 'Broadleaf-Isolate-01']